MANLVDLIVEGLLGKKKKLSEEKPIEEMENPVENPERQLKLGEIHKIGRVAKPR